MESKIVVGTAPKIVPRIFNKFSNINYHLIKDRVIGNLRSLGIYGLEEGSMYEFGKEIKRKFIENTIEELNVSNVKVESEKKTEWEKIYDYGKIYDTIKQFLEFKNHM